jgi:hypothetical protein
MTATRFFQTVLLVAVLAACGNLTPSGDVTSVTTDSASGLTGGSNFGAIALSLTTTCNDGEILKWDDVASAWACASDATGGGGGFDTAGTGLTSSGTTVNAGCVSNSLVCNSDTIGLASRDFGSITVGGSGTTMTIDNSAVTLAMMANINAGDFIGRFTGSTGTPEAMSTAQATSILNLFSTSGTNRGLVPGANGCGADCVLFADQTWDEVVLGVSLISTGGLVDEGTATNPEIGIRQDCNPGDTLRWMDPDTEGPQPYQWLCWPWPV